MIPFNEVIQNNLLISIFLILISIIVLLNIICIILSSVFKKNNLVLCIFSYSVSVIFICLSVIYILHDKFTSLDFLFTNWIYILPTCSFITLGLSIAHFVVLVNVIKRKYIFDTNMSIAQSNYGSDYFLSCNKHNKIESCSKSVLEHIKYDKKKLNTNGIDFIFNEFNIVKVNNSNPTEGLILSLKNDILTSINHFNGYKVSVVIFKDDTKSNFDLTIRGIYSKSNCIGYTISLIYDKYQIVKSLNEKINNLEGKINYKKNNLHSLMNSIKEPLLYFDEVDKMYFANKEFIKFSYDRSTTYSFEEFLKLIHPDDVNSYFEETKQVNSTYITRVNFRIKLNDIYLNAYEESIYLNSNDTNLVSIIHITDKSKSILSTLEANELLKKLADCDVSNMISSLNTNISQAMMVSDEE